MAVSWLTVTEPDRVAVEQICTLIAEGCGLAEAAWRCGVHPEGFDRLLDRDPAVRIAVDAAMRVASDRVEHAVFAAAIDGDVRACELWLRARRPERWAATSATTGDGVDISAVDEALDRLTRLAQGVVPDPRDPLDSPPLEG